MEQYRIRTVNLEMLQQKGRFSQRSHTHRVRRAHLVCPNNNRSSPTRHPARWPPIDSKSWILFRDRKGPTDSHRNQSGRTVDPCSEIATDLSRSHFVDMLLSLSSNPILPRELNSTTALSPATNVGLSYKEPVWMKSPAFRWRPCSTRAFASQTTGAI